MPGEFGECVPRRTTIEVGDLNLTERPDFVLRNWWSHAKGDMPDQLRRWKLHNKMNPDEIFAQPGDSSVRNFVADKELTKTRPELFAKTFDGKVDPNLPSLTNPEAVKIAAEKMKEIFRRQRERQSIGIAPDDGMPRDFSDQTAALNQGFYDVGGRVSIPGEASVTEEWIAFVNAICREVNKEFPDRIVTTNGYANRNTPPQGVRPDKNLGIMFAAIWCDALHPLDDPRSWQSIRQGQMIQQWCALSQRVWMYEYVDEMLVSALTPVPITRKLARDIPLLKRWGVIGFNDEGRSQWMEPGIATVYLRANLEWDAHADVDKVLSDFYDKWYGPAAPAARAFWDHMEAAMQGTPLLGHEDRILPYIYTPELMARLKADVEEAEQRATEEPARTHVHADRLIYDHLTHYVAMNAGEFAGDFAKAADEAGQMMQVRAQLMKITPFFCLDNENGYESGIGYWGVVARGKYYRKLADLTSGKTGRLVARLPERTAFALDPHDDGRFAGWYEPASDTSKWETIFTTQPFYMQGHMDAHGHPYVGNVWYRFEQEVPPSFEGKRVVLYCTTVETEAWVWVNGRYIGHRRYRESYERPNELQMDVTGAAQFGKVNCIAIRVATGQNPAAAAGGLQSRAFLYSPY